MNGKLARYCNDVSDVKALERLEAVCLEEGVKIIVADLIRTNDIIYIREKKLLVITSSATDATIKGFIAEEFSTVHITNHVVC